MGKHTLKQKDIEAIEKAINRSGATEALVKVEHGQIAVLQIEKKKIN